MKSRNTNAELQRLSVESWQVSDDNEVISHNDCIYLIELAEQDARDRAIDSIKLVLETINTVNPMSELDKCYLLGLFSNNYDK